VNAVADVAGEVWLAGAAADDGSGGPLLQRRIGQRWQRFAPDQPNLVIESMSAASADDIWAVGSERGDPAVIRWEGKTWSRVRAPGVKGGGRLVDVAALSPAHAWAISDHSIFRWNGARWNPVVTPRLPGLRFEFHAISADGPRRAWIVGSYADQTGGRALALAWNGSAWRFVPIPNRPNVPARLEDVGEYLKDVSILPSGVFWAVGATIERWDGQHWRRIPSPQGRHGWSVRALRANDVWIGTSSSGALYNWNGRTWRRTAEGRHDDSIVALAGRSPLWAVRTSGRRAPEVLRRGCATG